MGRIHDRHAHDLIPIALHSSPDDLISILGISAYGAVPAHHGDPINSTPVVHFDHSRRIPLQHDIIGARSLLTFGQYVRMRVKDEGRLWNTPASLSYAAIL